MTLMSGEFRTEYNENTIVAAVENMERNMRNCGYVGEYVQAIQETYAEYPEGEVELFRMIRAARLITNAKPGAISEEVQAVYHGELLGLELINNLEPGVGQLFKTGYAQSFMNNKLATGRPSHTEAVESGLDQQIRLQGLSESIQEDLAYPIYAYELNPMYEEFGQKATSKLSDELQYQQLAMMGYRMIITEALKPSVNDGTTELLDEYPAPIKETGSTVSIADLARNYARSINQTEEIIGNQEPFDFVDWEDISYVRKNIYRKYNRLILTDEEEQVSNLSTLVSPDKFTEDRLAKFILKNELIGIDDLLSVRGVFFGTSDDGNRFFYDDYTEVRGVFDGIHVIKTPSNEFLKNIHNSTDRSVVLDEPTSLEESVAIRILEPKFIYEEEDGEDKVLPIYDKTIDIPLNYRQVSFWRIKAEELEPEA